MASYNPDWPPLTAELNYTIGVLQVYGKFNGVPLTQAQIEYQLSHYYESKQGSLIAGTVVMMVASGIAVALRILSRRVKKAPLGADDYMALVGLVVFYGYSASFFVIIYYGLGHHSFRAGAYKFLHVGKPFYAWECLYGPVTFTTKMSILLLYRRVFVITNRSWQICFWTIIGLFSAWSIANFFKDVFQAIPIRALWSLVPNAKWINALDSFFYTGLINAILTVAILILPMPLIWQMHMSFWKRVGLCVLFGLGCGDILVIIARIIMVKFEKFPNTDFTWSVVPTAILSVVEQCIGILCASLPMTRSFILHVYRHGRSSKSSGWSSGEQQAARQGKQQGQAGTPTQYDTSTPTYSLSHKGSVPGYDEKNLGLIPLAKIETMEDSPVPTIDPERSDPAGRTPSKEPQASWNPLSSPHAM